MLKKRISFLIIALLILSLSVSVFAQEKIQLRVSWWGSETRHQATLDAIAFMKN